MHRLTTTPRLWQTALAVLCLALLALPAAAAAKSGDRDRDKMPDRWERRHKLNPKNKRDARRDNDRDGLRNLAEYRSHTNPRDADSDDDGVGDADEDRDRDRVDNGNETAEHTSPTDRDSDDDGRRDGREDADGDRLDNAGEDATGNDPMDRDSDDDGVEDGDERAGEIVSFEDGVLTVRVFGGATLSGRVDDFTDIECEDEDGYEHGDEVEDDDSGHVVDRGGSGEDGEEPGESEHSDDEDKDEPSHEDGDDESDEQGDDHGESGDDEVESESACGVEALVAGAIVHEAELELTSEGAFFTEIELVAAGDE